MIFLGLMARAWDTPGEATPESVAEVAAQLSGQYRATASLFTHPYLLMPIGHDFSFREQ